MKYIVQNTVSYPFEIEKVSGLVGLQPMKTEELTKQELDSPRNQELMKKGMLNLIQEIRESKKTTTSLDHGEKIPVKKITSKKRGKVNKETK